MFSKSAVPTFAIKLEMFRNTLPIMAPAELRPPLSPEDSYADLTRRYRWHQLYFPSSQ
jgi:hypothetical protein